MLRHGVFRKQSCQAKHVYLLTPFFPNPHNQVGKRTDIFHLSDGSKSIPRSRTSDELILICGLAFTPLSV